MKLFDAQGKETEAFTQAELDTKVQEASLAVKMEFETKQKEIQTQADNKIKEANDALVKAQTDLASADSKDANYKALREAKDAAEAKAAQAIADKTDIIKQVTEGVTNTFAVKYKNDLIDKLAAGDQKLKDKLIVHYEKSLAGMPATTDSEVAARLEMAYKLSVENAQPGIFNQIIGHKPSSNGGNGGGSNEISSELEKWGQQFGLNKDDIKKYGDKAKKNYVNVIDPNK